MSSPPLIPPPAASSADDPNPPERPSTPIPNRPQLHIDTSPITTPPSAQNIEATTPPRSRDGQRLSIHEYNPPPSGSPSIRSTRSEAPRVRFSSDVQTLGDRAMVSPSITAEDALARLHHSSSMTSLSRRAGTIPSELPHVPPTSPPSQEQIRGILRAPSINSGTSYSSQAQPARRPNRPRGWSLRRQLFSKQEGFEAGKSPTELASLPTHIIPPASPRPSRSIEDVDAIRVVTAALDQARKDPPLAQIQASPKKIPMIEPEVTQVSLPFYSNWATSHHTRHMLLQKCKDLMGRIKRLRDPRLISKGQGREIPIDVPERGRTNLLDERTGREYVDNLITSSRYTVYSFLPRQLWAQFSKVANLYFLNENPLILVISLSWR
jgi:phospholipid-translocating ATPase